MIKWYLFIIKTHVTISPQHPYSFPWSAHVSYSSPLLRHFLKSIRFFSSSFLASITDFSMDIWRENGMLFRFWHGVDSCHRQREVLVLLGIRVAGTAQYSSLWTLLFWLWSSGGWYRKYSPFSGKMIFFSLEKAEVFFQILAIHAVFLALSIPEAESLTHIAFFLGMIALFFALLSGAFYVRLFFVNSHFVCKFEWVIFLPFSSSCRHLWETLRPCWYDISPVFSVGMLLFLKSFLGKIKHGEDSFSPLWQVPQRVCAFCIYSSVSADFSFCEMGGCLGRSSDLVRLLGMR